MTPLDERLVTELEAAVVELGDIRDVPRSERAMDAFMQQRNHLTTCIRHIRDGSARIADLTPKVQACDQWVTHLTTWRAQWVPEVTELSAVKSRTPEQERRLILLTTALRNIDHGAEYISGYPAVSGVLLDEIRAAYTPTWQMNTKDPWGSVGYGCLSHATEQLTTWREQLLEAERKLDAARIMAQHIVDQDQPEGGITAEVGTASPARL